MVEGLVRFRAVVEDDDADAEDLDELLRRLHEDLRATDADDVTLVGGSPPPGAKAVESLLGVAVASAIATIPSIVSMLHGWARARRCTLRLEGPDGATLEIPDVSEDEARRLVARWTASPDDDG